MGFEYHTDRASDADHLHFSDFRPALAEVLLRAETPLTMAIYGPWGSGKSTLLRMLRRDLERAGGPDTRTIWFTAWKYDRHEALWRAFMLRVLDALYPRQEADGAWEERPRKADENLTEEETHQVESLRRLEESLYRPVEWQELGKLTADWGRLLPETGRAAGVLAELFVPGGGLVRRALDALAKDETRDAGEEPSLRKSLSAIRREAQSHRLEQLTSMEQFEASFRRALETTLGSDGRLVIFVDDLDRCLPEKALEVLETIKLFLEVEGAIFVLGMDKKVIEHGIEIRYRSHAPGTGDGPVHPSPIRGEDYLQKIVQIPFYLPPIGEEDIGRLITRLEHPGTGRKTFDLDEELRRIEEGRELSRLTRRVLARGLVPNPRQVKRVLNIFRLLQGIALVRIGRGSLPPRSVAWPLLAKTVLIQAQYPEVYEQWRKEPRLIVWLENHFRGIAEDDESRDPYQERLLEPFLEARDWQRYQPLGKLLAFPSESEVSEDGLERSHFGRLSAPDIQIYLRLAGSVEMEGARVEQLGDIWTELESGEPERVRAATRQILEHPEEDKRHEAVWLLQRRLDVGSEPTSQRIAWAEALGTMGNRRRAVQILEGQLAGDDDEIVEQAMESLALLEHAPVAERLLERCLAPHSAARQGRALEILQLLGDPAVGVLRRLVLRTGETRVGRDALETLARLETPKAREALETLAREGPRETRVETLVVLLHEDVRHYLPWLGDQPEELQRLILSSLEPPAQQWVEELLELLTESDDAQIHEWTRELLEAADAADLEPLLNSLGHPKARVRNTLTQVIADQGSQMTDLLRHRLQDAEPEVVDHVRTIFLAMGEDALPQLLWTLNHSHAEAREVAVTCLAELGDESTFSDLAPACFDEVPRIRSAAHRALRKLRRRFDPKGHVSELTAGDAAARRTAATLTAALAEPELVDAVADDPALALEILALTDSEHAPLREGADWAIRRLAPDTFLPKLLDGLEPDLDPTQIDRIETLISPFGDRAVELLLERVQRQPAPAPWVLELLGRLGDHSMLEPLIRIAREGGPRGEAARRALLAGLRRLDLDDQETEDLLLVLFSSEGDATDPSHLALDARMIQWLESSPGLADLFVSLGTTEDADLDLILELSRLVQPATLETLRSNLASRGLARILDLIQELPQGTTLSSQQLDLLHGALMEVDDDAITRVLSDYLYSEEHPLLRQLASSVLAEQSLVGLG